MTSIESGLYTISSKVSDAVIGRFPVEDLSLLPKRIMRLSDGASSSHAAPWVIEKSANGYKLKTHGAPVGESDQKLWAYLIREDAANEWLITAVPQMGDNTYIIEKTDRSAGWAVTDEEDSQVVVTPLVETRSLPPMYPHNQLFTITPAEY